MQKLTRRELIKMSALGITGAVVAACAPAAAPTTAPAPATEVPAAPKATDTSAPAAPAATDTPAAMPAAQVKPPIPYPDPNKMDLGGAAAKRQKISEIVTYKALPEYKQPAFMDKFVTAGTIPAVKDRLPKEPQVVLTSGMADGVGVYGDMWRGFSACPTAGWNNMAGTTAGWFGIEFYSTNHACLVKTGQLYRADQDIEPFPNTAKSWDWSDDGKTLTIHLIEGAKWSDGQPFTADDVMFTWEGYIVDPQVNANRKIANFTWNGTAATLEKVDDFTVKFTFPVSKPYDVFYNINEPFLIEPAHILKPLHPKWSTANPKPTYKDFENALPPQNLPVVDMGPFVPIEYKTDELMIMRRNPFFWKVDESGQQLPYLNEVQYRKGPSGVGRDLCTMSGDCDHMNLENPSSFVQAMTRAQEADAKFSISWGPELLGYIVSLNYAVELADNDRDKAVRTLFQDVRFRKAISYASDRDGISQAIMRGPFLRGYAGGLYPGAPDFDQASVVYYPYDVDSAKALLAEIGLKDTNNDGILEWTDGTQKGQSVIIQMSASEDAHETQTVAEALVNQWAAVGIKVNMRTMTSTARTDMYNTANWDLSVDRGGQNLALPFTDSLSLAPISKTFNSHRQGDKDRVLMDVENQMVDIVQKYRLTFDAAERKSLLSQWNKLCTESVYHLGTFVGRYGLGITKRMKNIPGGTPVFMYQWVEDAVMLEQLWTPVEGQLKENRPDTIPIFKKA